MTMKVFYNPDHQQHDPPFEGYTPEKLLPAFEKAERAEIVHAALQETNWSEIHSSADFGLEPLLAVHSVEYLDYLLSAYDNWQPFSLVPEMAFIPGTFGIDHLTANSMSGTEQYGFFLMDTTVSINPFTYRAAVKAANCALSGAQTITQGEQVAFALCRPPGHHAGREVCGGYCFLNNAAIAAQWFSGFGKVAILDVDYHAGNGTQDIFYSRPGVLTVSIHADPAFEYPRYAGFANETGTGAGVGYHRNFPLPAGTEQPRYLEALAEALELINRFEPKYLVVSAGMDIYKDEPLGTFKITTEGIHQIGQRIAQIGLPTLIVMEGGYHIPSLGDNFVAFLEPFSSNR
jgi:acetoin utilization deacetylase AcuC-like enzyme